MYLKLWKFNRSIQCININITKCTIWNYMLFIAIRTTFMEFHYSIRFARPFQLFLLSPRHHNFILCIFRQLAIVFFCCLSCYFAHFSFLLFLFPHFFFRPHTFHLLHFRVLSPIFQINSNQTKWPHLKSCQPSPKFLTTSPLSHFFPPDHSTFPLQDTDLVCQ